MSKFKSGCVPWVLGTVVVCVGLMILGRNAPVSRPNEDKKEQPASTSNGQDKIDGELFGEMRPSVTRQSTVQSLLDVGELVSSSSVGGIATQGYVIRNSDGSTATLIFQNGVLAMKSEVGLH